jgi:hypothetical protein
MAELTQQMGQHAMLAALVFVLLFAASLAIALTVLIRLPPDYLRTPRTEDIRLGQRTAGLWVRRISRNFLGAMLVVVGAVLSLPSIPGQGLITIIAGILLLEFPGRLSLLRKILRRGPLLGSINRMRAKFSHPPLIVE